MTQPQVRELPTLPMSELGLGGQYGSLAGWVLMSGGLREFGALTRNQRTLFWAQLVESFGAFGLVSAFSLWATTQPGGSTRITQLVSWVIAANTLPRMVLAPAVAYVCHRFDESHILQAANAARAMVCTASLVVWSDTWVSRAPAVIGVVLLLGCLDQFFGPARAAAAQRNLREHERVHYGALNFLALSGVGLVSAASTPALFAAGGLTLWLWIGMACSVVSMLLLLAGYSAARDLHPRAPRIERPRDSVWATARFALTDSGVALVTWSLVGYGLALGLTNQTMTPLAINGLGIALHRYGWITAAFAVGGLAAYALTRAATRRWTTASTLVVGAGLLSAGYLGYALATSLLGCIVAMLLAGVGFGLWSSVQGAILQALVPNERMAAYVAVTGTMALVANLAGSQTGRILVRITSRHGHAMTGYRASYLIAATAVMISAALRRTANTHTTT